MGLGTLLMFLGVSLFSSRLVRPLAAILGWPATAAGRSGGRCSRATTRAATRSEPPRLLQR